MMVVLSFTAVVVSMNLESDLSIFEDVKGVRC